MDKVIKGRIDAIKNRCIPSGYCRTKDIGVAPEDWTLGKVSDVVNPIKRAVPKPDKPYWRLGIKSWAKGTFHAYVDEPENVDMDELYEVHENDLVVNITFAWEHAIAIANKDDQGLLVSHRFPTYEFNNGQVAGYYKAVITQKFFKDMLDHISPGGAGRNRVLNRKDFLNLPCYVPPFAEQEKISEILDHYDKLIKLCEAKVDEYKGWKKACLRKMFPQNGSSVPELRFPGFTDAWEQRKLGEIGTTYTGLSGKSKSDFGHGKGKFITYMNVFSNPITSPEGVEPIEIDDRQNEVETGDVFFTTSSETPEEVGMSSVLLENKGKTYLNSFCFGYRPTEKIDSHFLAYMLRSHNVRKKIIFLAQGISRYNISKNKMMDIAVPIPSYGEQEQIGLYFKQLDNLITLHQREVEEYTKLKKAMTQLLLTGIVRV